MSYSLAKLIVHQLKAAYTDLDQKPDFEKTQNKITSH